MIKVAAAFATAIFLFSSQSVLAQARVAVAHFASFADTVDGTEVDIAVNGTVALPGVKYGDTTDYIPFDAGTYTIDVIPAGASEPAITADFVLEDGNDYTVFAAGDGANQPLELMALLDNTADPMAGNLWIRIVHAAPFSSNLDATEVSIRTAGGDVVNGLVGVPYGVQSGFFQVPADTYDLKVASNDGSTNYIDPLPVPLPAGAKITVFAIGDGSNQDLALFAYPVGFLDLRTPVDNRSNGMYEILEGSGTGFVFQPIPGQNRLVGTWYTYDDGAPTFLTFDSCMEAEDGSAPGVCATPGAFDGVTATTALYQSTGGGPSENDTVTTVKVGEIDWTIMSCDEVEAVVRIDGADPATFNGVQLTRPFPCVDEEAVQ